jgi:hypothetical protein
MAPAGLGKPIAHALFREALAVSKSIAIQFTGSVLNT